MPCVTSLGCVAATPAHINGITKSIEKQLGLTEYQGLCARVFASEAGRPTHPNTLVICVH